MRDNPAFSMVHESGVDKSGRVWTFFDQFKQLLSIFQTGQRHSCHER